MKKELEKLVQVLESKGFRTALSDEYKKEIKEILKGVIGTDMENVCCNLFHYMADTDIRNRDTEYRKFQDKELEELIKALKAGDWTRAKAINFLYETSD